MHLFYNAMNRPILTHIDMSMKVWGKSSRRSPCFVRQPRPDGNG